jgi:hypothetical protein
VATGNASGQSFGAELELLKVNKAKDFAARVLDRLLAEWPQAAAHFDKVPEVRHTTMESVSGVARCVV